MQPALKKNSPIEPKDVSMLVKTHYSTLMPSFYETQSLFLSGIYKRYSSIETAIIILCFARTMHLEIIRQRENDFNYNVSLEKFWYNFNKIKKPEEKITSIVTYTGIPKETVRRKIKKLSSLGYLEKIKGSKGYSWTLSEDDKAAYYKIVEDEIKILSKFINKLSTFMNLKLDFNDIEKEIKSQFSFYWYHFLSCELEWLRYWQTKLKDNDLILIILQTVIPTIQYVEKNLGDTSLENIFKIIGRTQDKTALNHTAVSASAVSEVTGIPRATCMRKLDRLSDLHFLVRDKDSKRYFINQNSELRTKNIMTKENVNNTIDTFSRYFSNIINGLLNNKR